MTAPVKHIRQIIFLKDVLLLALTAFGGAQAHLGMFYKVLVKKRAYITEEALTELYTFCQILPGPASTQTITAVGFKIGGPRLAFLTLLVWILPAVSVMTTAAIFVSYLGNETLTFAKYIPPIAVAFVFFAAWRMACVSVNTKSSYAIFIISGVFCYLIETPAIFPIVLILGGLATSWRIRKQPKEEIEPLKIEWGNLILYGAIFIGAAAIGGITHALPIRLFENFFRNGSLVFGGGQALTGLFYKEFVSFKEYLTDQEFLTGYAILQSLPGPIFSFSSYIGAMSMQENGYGVGGQILGGVIGAVGIFLPGALLIFFIIRFWDRLKKYRVVKASLEGLNAASVGVVTATALMLFAALIPDHNWTDGLLNYIIAAATFAVLLWDRIPSPFIILAGLAAGFLF